MGQKYTEAKKTCNKRWDAANLDRMSLAMPKGRKDAIKAHAATTGESMNRFINRAIKETMERDNRSVTSSSRKPGAGNPLSSKTLELAKGAAERMGETLKEFLSRAVWETAKRDEQDLELAVKAYIARPDEIRAYIERTGETVNDFFKRAIMQTMREYREENAPVCKKEETEARCRPDEII